MKEGLISRRNFLKGVIGAAVAAEAAYATRLGSPNNIISPEILNDVEKFSSTLSSRINVDPKLFSEIEHNGKIYIPSLNKKTMSDSILYLSYLDGGKKELNDTFKFLEERGIYVREETEALGSVIPTLFKGEPVELGINKQLVNYYIKELPKPTTDFVFHHEFIHIIQQTRNPELYEKFYISKILIYLGAVPLFFGIKGGKAVYNAITEDNDIYKVNRRKFISGLGLGIATGIGSAYIGIEIAKGFGPFLCPNEVQAYVQGGASWQIITNIGDLKFEDSNNKLSWQGQLSSRLPENMRGKILRYQEKQ